MVVVTDYPDPLIMNTLKGNVERARLQRGKPHPRVATAAVQVKQGTEESNPGPGEERDLCDIEYAEYEWASDVSHLLLSDLHTCSPLV